MELKRIFILYFSPTGGTRRVMRALITGTPREGFAIRDFEFTLPEERRMRRFTEEDAVVLCAPVYYGRIPTPLQIAPILHSLPPAVNENAISFATVSVVMIASAAAVL